MRVCSGWRRFLILLPLILILSHLNYVLELHQKVIEDQPKKQNKKFNHLVLGPAAGQGLPNRLQCEGSRALNRTHSQTSSNAGDGVSLVTVFTIYNSSVNVHGDDSRSSDMVTVGNASYSKTERSMSILNVFINFIQAAMPRSNVVILTDPASDLSVHRNHVTTFLDIKLKDLHSTGRVNHYIFTDSDIAVVDDLGHMFHDYPNFHLALTFRNNKGQPLNSGFIAVRGTQDGLLRSKKFLEKVLQVYRSKYMSASRMLGDQLALAWVVRSNPTFDSSRFSKPQAFEAEINEASVLFLPCALYNWTPPEGAGQFHGMPLDVKVVHFKGSRKRLMLESWNLFNSSNNMSDMLCLILKSGRTKYDF
ncbi:hypothetical protein LINPERHAP2_LOCUS35430 [Linum perenne]